MEIGPGSLKCVAAWSPRRRMRPVVERALGEHVREQDVRHLFGDLFVVYTDAEVAAVRDWLVPHLAEGESAFVAEFERWAARGPGADPVWLRARGH
ncbi:MAG TPA: hypothetical protein VIO14_02545 [Dehalococcoidia bacterium]